ncbi:hypothetical protein [Moorena producens]|uniref:hypothetical protein n=1 Tax=Moorena producens TaxID=1155739 RepID=UPI003C7447AF
MFKTINNRKLLSNFIVFILIVVTFFSIAYQTRLITSGFRYFIDDHLIPQVSYDLTTKGFFKTVYNWINFDKSLNRFRPFYIIHLVTATKIFGINSTLWLLYITLLSSLTTFFLFLFGRLLNFSVLIAFVFSISTLLGSQSDIWTRPTLPEAYAMFFLSASLVFLGLSCKQKYNEAFTNVVFVILTIFMSICKESFLIFIPTLMLGKLFLYKYERQHSLWQSLKDNKFTLLFLASTFVLEIYYILFYLGTAGTGYAGLDESSFKFYSILSTSKVFFTESHLVIAFIGLGLSLILTKLNRDSIVMPLREFAPFLILLLVSAAPHILLYSKSGINPGYYLFPAIVVACLFLAKVLSYMARYSQWLSLSLVAILVVILLNRVPLVWNMYSLQAKDSKYMNDLFKQVELCTPKNDKLLIVANPRVRYEVLAGSLPTVLKHVINRDNFLLATYGLEKTNFYSETLKESEKIWEFLNPESVLGLYQNKTILNTKNKSDIEAVIIFDGLDNDFIKTNKDWFSPQDYQFHEFKISFSLVHLYCKQ